MVSAWLITIADIPAQVTSMMAPFMDNKLLLMAILMVLVYAVGTALDLAPTVLILTPVLMPLVKQAGIDPYYFGIMFMMNNAIGLITPPVGTVLNVVSSVARVNLDTVIKGMWPVLVAETLVMFLLVLFPQLVIIPGALVLLTGTQKTGNCLKRGAFPEFAWYHSERTSEDTRVCCSLI